MDSESNLAVIQGTGELVYYVAAVVVIYDKNANRQRHYIEHTEDITA
jgi:microtubule-associated protein-like 1/2